MRTPQVEALPGTTPLGLVPTVDTVEAAWEDHLENHSFADGTADPTTCSYCELDVADGSWTDDFINF